MPNNTKANRRTMAFIYHMRRSAVSAGRQAGRPDKGNHLESGGIRGNMLTRRFAFVPPLYRTKGEKL